MSDKKLDTENPTNIMEQLEELKNLLNLLSESMDFDGVLEALRELRSAAESMSTDDDIGADFCTGEDDEDDDGNT